MKSEKKKVTKEKNANDEVPIAKLKGTDRSRILALQIEKQHEHYVSAAMRPKPPLPSPCNSGVDCFLPIIDKDMPLVNPRTLKATLFVPYIEMIKGETIQVRFLKYLTNEFGVLEHSAYEVVNISTSDKENADPENAPVSFMKKIPIKKQYLPGHYSVEVTDASSNIIKLFFLLTN